MNYSYLSNTMLFRAGERTESMGLVLSGSINIEADDPYTLLGRQAASPTRRRH